MMLTQAIIMARLAITLDYGQDYHLILAITQSILYCTSTILLYTKCSYKKDYVLLTMYLKGACL